MKKHHSAVKLISALLALSGFAYGESVWTGNSGIDLNWNTVSNWVDGIIPASGDHASFRGLTNATGNAMAELTSAATIGNLRLGGFGTASTLGTPTLTLKSGSALTGSADAHVGYSLIQDGVDAIGNLIIEDGTHTFPSLNIGNIAGGTNTNGANGTVTMENGSVTLTSILRIGTRAGTATGTTTGALTLNGGSLSNANTGVAAYIGHYGTGTLTLDGGDAVFTGELKLANQSGSTGTIKLLDGHLACNTITEGPGTPSIEVGGGYLTMNGFRISKVTGWLSDGEISAIGGVTNDAALTSVYTGSTGTATNGFYILKWGYSAALTETAVWALDISPPPGTRLTLSFSDPGAPVVLTPSLTTTISIDGSGTVSSSHTNITATLSGNPLPSELYNQSFTYTINGRRDLNSSTGLGSAEKDLSIGAQGTINPQYGIRNNAGSAAQNGLLTHELGLSGLPSGYNIELQTIETAFQAAGEIATFIDLVTPANRTSVDGGTGYQSHDVTGLGIAVESASAQTAFLSMCALTTDPTCVYDLRTLTFNIIAQTTAPPPEGSYEAWMLAYTNELSEAEQAKDADPDADSLENLMEYALGGDPTIDDADDIQPTITIVGSGLEYLYNRRTNHAEQGLSYYLELTPDLVNTLFTNDTSVYTVDGVSEPVGEFETVTNTVDTGIDARFITLTVEEQ